MFNFKDKYDFTDLIEIVKILRSENGCPWDKEQTHQSVRMDILEEACEVMEAIDLNNPEMLKEELGDLLLQVVFHGQISEEANNFNIYDICNDICKKLIYRHPHVFSDVVVSNTEEVLFNWNELKKKSKGQNSLSETLNSVPITFPALMRAQKVNKRAAEGVGLINNNVLIKKLICFLQELENDNDNIDIESKFGDFLFLTTILARYFKIDCEKVLTYSTNKFIMRFEDVENIEKNSCKSIYELSENEIYKLFNLL